MSTPIVGRWRTIAMEVWDTDAVDLLGPAYVELDRSGRGSFRMLVVEGWLE